MPDHDPTPSASEPERVFSRQEEVAQNQGVHNGYMAAAAETGVWPSRSEQTLLTLGDLGLKPTTSPRRTPAWPKTRKKPVREGFGDSELDGADEDGVVSYHKPARPRVEKEIVVQQKIDGKGRAEVNTNLGVHNFDEVGRRAAARGVSRAVIEQIDQSPRTTYFHRMRQR